MLAVDTAGVTPHAVEEVIFCHAPLISSKGLKL